MLQCRSGRAAHKLQDAGMKLLEAWAMTDAQDGASGSSRSKIDMTRRWLSSSSAEVASSRNTQAWPMQQQPGKGDHLLLAKRQILVESRVAIEPGSKSAKPTRLRTDSISACSNASGGSG